MLGFAIFRPICPFASSTSNAIQVGLTNLETFSTNNFSTALSAASAARTLNEYIELYSKGFQISLARSSRTSSSSVETPQQDMPTNILLNISNKSPVYDQANKSLTFPELDTQAGPTMVLPNFQNTPRTAEEFAARMASEMHLDDTLWLLDQNIDPGTMDTNMGIWADWMNDR
jgi:hypothetical protein